MGCEADAARRTAFGRLRVPLVLAAACGVCTAAPAAQWNVQPSIDVGAVRDDNIRLTTLPHETTSGYVAAAELEVERNTATSEAEFSGAVVHSDYSSGDVEDTTENRALLEARNRTSERGELGLRAEYRRDTLFETIVFEEGTGDIRDVDVGLSDAAEVRRHYRVIQPSWTWALTELSSVHFLYRGSDVNFSEAEGTDLIDYDSDLLSATYNRRLSPQNSFHVTASASRYRPERDDNDAETVQLLAGMGREFSETLEGSFSLGASRTTEEGVVEERSTGVVVRGVLRQRSELSTLEGVISRDVTPSGIGRALETDQLRLYWTRRITPTTEFIFDALWLRTNVVEGFDPDAERRYYDLSPKLGWQWLANTFVVLSYSYRYQKYDTQAESADSSALFLGLSYRL